MTLKIIIGGRKMKLKDKPMKEIRLKLSIKIYFSGPLLTFITPLLTFIITDVMLTVNIILIQQPLTLGRM